VSEQQQFSTPLFISLLQCVTNLVFATQYTTSHRMWKEGFLTLEHVIAAVARHYISSLATSDAITLTHHCLRTFGALLLYVSSSIGVFSVFNVFFSLRFHVFLER
jgi:hypothetical protein